MSTLWAASVSDPRVLWKRPSVRHHHHPAPTPVGSQMPVSSVSSLVGQAQENL